VRFVTQNFHFVISKHFLFSLQNQTV